VGAILKTIQILSVFLSLAVGAEALACKPAPLGECEKASRVKLRAPTLKALTEKVNSFQKHLTANLAGAAPEGQTSCFNNGFASYYLDGVKQYSAKHKKFFCPTHLDQVDAAVKALIKGDSMEMKAVKDSGAAEKLREEAKGVQVALDKFIGAHNM